ncbi:MAG TPA: acyltransferase, partial [Nitrospirota bacterium]
LPLNSRLAFFLFLALVLSLRTQMLYIISFLTIPYLVLYFAYAKIPAIKNFGRYGDYSYGVYIYGFPIQQMVLLFLGPHINRFIFFIIAYAITLIISVLSWNFIENPALRLKDRSFMIRIPAFSFFAK